MPPVSVGPNFKVAFAQKIIDGIRGRKKREVVEKYNHALLMEDDEGNCNSKFARIKLLPIDGFVLQMLTQLYQEKEQRMSYINDPSRSTKMFSCEAIGFEACKPRSKKLNGISFLETVEVVLFEKVIKKNSHWRCVIWGILMWKILILWRR